MRYYFDMREGDQLIVDEEGMNLPSIEAVQEEAALSWADMARDAALRRCEEGAADQIAIEVRDCRGPVLQARFTFDANRRKPLG